MRRERQVELSRSGIQPPGSGPLARNRHRPVKPADHPPALKDHHDIALIRAQVESEDPARRPRGQARELNDLAEVRARPLDDVERL
jgi:hypothetical protein